MATQPAAAGIAPLQTQLGALRGYYNNSRPRRALRRRTPAEACAARPKAAASGIPLIDGHFRVRHDRIDTTGTTTEGYTTSASAADTPAHHPSWSWFTTCTSACSEPADNYSEI